MAVFSRSVQVEVAKVDGDAEVTVHDGPRAARVIAWITTMLSAVALEVGLFEAFSDKGRG